MIQSPFWPPGSLSSLQRSCRSSRRCWGHLEDLGIFSPVEWGPWFLDMGMGQYLSIPFLVGWTSILTQLFWGSLGARVLTNSQISLGGLNLSVNSEIVNEKILFATVLGCFGSFATAPSFASCWCRVNTSAGSLLCNSWFCCTPWYSDHPDQI